MVKEISLSASEIYTVELRYPRNVKITNNTGDTIFFSTDSPVSSSGQEITAGEIIELKAKGKINLLTQESGNIKINKL